MLSAIFVSLLLFVGLYFTVCSRFYSLRHLGKALKAVLVPAKGKHGGITAFSSLCTTLGATIGTGNIVGVASAVSLGGPGVLFWMLAGSVVSMMTKCAENMLAVRYSRRDSSGQRLGGPFCYIEDGLGRKFVWVGRLYAVSCLLAGVLGMGTIIQSASIVRASEQMIGSGNVFSVCGIQFSRNGVICAAVLTLLTAFVILGGARRIASVSASVVPVMAVGYTMICFVILLANYRQIPDALRQILICAFTPSAVGGAAAGLTIGQVVSLGMQRAIFSNEAGLGTSAIAAASAEDGDAKLQGYSGIVSVFIDTVLLCTLTGLVVIVTGAEGESGVSVATNAVEKGLPWSSGVSRAILSCFLIIFGFTSVLGWNFSVDCCLRYLFDNPRITLIYQMLYLAAVFLGPFLSDVFAWKIADITNALMAIPNLLAIFLLRKQVLREI